MKVCLDLNTESHGIKRVNDALKKYAPKEIEIVDFPSESDLTVLHVWGRHTTTQKQVDWLKANNKPYAMIQYCLRSTMRPNTKDWVEMWNEATLVWSYYNLKSLCAQDNVFNNFNFYHAPLGVDSEIFNPKPIAKEFVIATCSQGYLTEGVKEAHRAVLNVKKKMFHLGKELNKRDMLCRTGISDSELAWYYSRSAFVSGLRRKEGFEFPVIEGLLCGARPIVFDRPEMRQWFGDLAIFIPEEPREKVVESLTRIFNVSKSLYPFVTKQEIEIAKERFDWEKIIKGFWDKVV